MNGVDDTVDTNLPPYTGEERRVKCLKDASCDKLDEVNSRLDQGAVRMKCIDERIERIEAVQAEMTVAHKRMEEKIDDNTKTTEESAKQNSEILDILTLGKSFFRLAGYFGTFVKWGTGLAVALFTLYYTFVHGRPPP